ncbi:hypothetical protein EON65_29700 [archaeon]|nr:MAG: hypothetical protein EON65_29700 [archaeon]
MTIVTNAITINATARSGFAAEVRFTPKLANFMDAPSAPRTDVSKKIWAYIKEHGLQDPQDKRQILCDNSLKALLGVNKVHMFTMNKILQPVSIALN